ncbi:MAG TPA: hypothetical protein VES60_03215, partial [Nakamurella sp.]|nr:hypothetical protein [Nakamurella sp.]
TDVFVVGTNRELYHRWGAGGTWSAWESLGGQLTSSPTAISFSTGTLVCSPAAPTARAVEN